MVSEHEIKGWVYIITNPAMPDLLKVGYTSRTPEARAAELDGTSSPYPHEVEYAVRLLNPKSFENKIHRQLNTVNVGKEWFRCSLVEAVEVIRYEVYEAVTFEQIGRKLKGLVQPLGEESFSNNKDLEDNKLEKFDALRVHSKQYELRLNKIRNIQSRERSEIGAIVSAITAETTSKKLAILRRKDPFRLFGGPDKNLEIGYILRENDSKIESKLNDYFAYESEKHRQKDTKFVSNLIGLSIRNFDNASYSKNLSTYVKMLKEKTVGIDDEQEFTDDA